MKQSLLWWPDGQLELLAFAGEPQTRLFYKHVQWALVLFAPPPGSFNHGNLPGYVQESAHVKGETP